MWEQYYGEDFQKRSFHKLLTHSLTNNLTLYPSHWITTKCCFYINNEACIERMERKAEADIKDEKTTEKTKFGIRFEAIQSLNCFEFWVELPFRSLLILNF